MISYAFVSLVAMRWITILGVSNYNDKYPGYSVSYPGYLSFIPSSSDTRLGCPTVACTPSGKRGALPQEYMLIRIIS